MELYKIQGEVRDWSNYNFGDQGPFRPFLGVVEEVGELSHVLLKEGQGIREGTDRLASFDKKVDAVADIMIYLLDFCSRSSIDLESALLKTWHDVKTRDWKKYPKTGRPPKMDSDHPNQEAPSTAASDSPHTMPKSGTSGSVGNVPLPSWHPASQNSPVAAQGMRLN